MTASFKPSSPDVTEMDFACELEVVGCGLPRPSRCRLMAMRAAPTVSRNPCEAQAATGKEEGHWEASRNRPCSHSVGVAPMLRAHVPRRAGMLLCPVCMLRLGLALNETGPEK